MNVLLFSFFFVCLLWVASFHLLFLPYLNSVCLGLLFSLLGFVELASIVIWMLLPLWILWQNSVCWFMYWQLTSTHHSQQLMKEDAKMEISSSVAGQYKSCCCCWMSLNLHECHCLSCSCSAYSLLSFVFLFGFSVFMLEFPRFVFPVCLLIFCQIWNLCNLIINSCLNST